jgi:hypothetical protein
MKVALIAFLAVGAVAAVVGAFLVLRSDDGSSTTDFAKQLNALCVDARRQVEALGQPSTTPMSTLYPGTVRIGRAFLKQAKGLRPPPEQTAAAQTFLAQRGLYYDGLAYAYQFFAVQKNQTAFVQIVNGALSNLDHAEAAAKTIGAMECTLRPFE